MAQVKWIKLSTSMFDDEKIKLIESMPDADTILIIWIKLLSQAGKTNASGYIYLNENIPYTDEMLSTIFNRPLSAVRLALETFKSFGMIEIDDKSFIQISNWEKHQNVEGLEKIREQTRKRVAKHRERKRRNHLVANQGENSDVTLQGDEANPHDERDNEGVTLHVTQSNATEEEVEEEREEEREEDKEIKDVVEKKFSDDSQETILTKLLVELMLRNNPNARVPKTEKQKERWIDALEKTHRLDGYTFEQIKQAIVWSQNDDFWKSNILSTTKLRNKMQTLVLQMERSTARPESRYQQTVSALDRLYEEAVIDEQNRNNQTH